MAIKKFLIKIYQAVANFFLNNAGCKIKWGNKKGD